MDNFEYEYKLLSELISKGANCKGFLNYLYNSSYLKELCSIYIEDLDAHAVKRSDSPCWHHKTYDFSLIAELKKNKPLYHRCALIYIQSLKWREFVNLFKELP